MSEWDFPEEYSVSLTHDTSISSTAIVYASSPREAAEQYVKTHREANSYTEGGEHATVFNPRTGEMIKYYVAQRMVPMYEAYEDG